MEKTKILKENWQKNENSEEFRGKNSIRSELGGVTASVGTQKVSFGFRNLERSDYRVRHTQQSIELWQGLIETVRDRGLQRFHCSCRIKLYNTRNTYYSNWVPRQFYR